jgi:hypothetical protein
VIQNHKLKKQDLLLKKNRNAPDKPFLLFNLNRSYKTVLAKIVLI